MRPIGTLLFGLQHELLERAFVNAGRDSLGIASAVEEPRSARDFSVCLGSFASGTIFIASRAHVPRVISHNA